MTMPYITTTGSQPMTSGATYGVGMVPVVHFDEPITDKAAAEKALIVTTKPPVAGVVVLDSTTRRALASADTTTSPAPR